MAVRQCVHWSSHVAQSFQVPEVDSCTFLFFFNLRGQQTVLTKRSCTKPHYHPSERENFFKKKFWENSFNDRWEMWKEFIASQSSSLAPIGALYASSALIFMNEYWEMFPVLYCFFFFRNYGPINQRNVQNGGKH